MAVSVEYKDSIICVEFSGSLSCADLVNGIEQVEAIEERLDVIPSRVTSVSVTEIQIEFDDLLALTSLRRAMRFPNRFKSALVVGNEAQTGFARMFQTLNTNPQIDIRMFHDRESALAWI
jgi:hypothetical protein